MDHVATTWEMIIITMMEQTSEHIVLGPVLKKPLHVLSIYMAVSVKNLVHYRSLIATQS